MTTRITVVQEGAALTRRAQQVQQANREAQLNKENDRKLSERINEAATEATTPVSTGGNPDTRVAIDPAAQRRGINPMHCWLYEDYASSTGIRTLTIYSPNGQQSVSWTEGADVIRESTYPWEDWGSAGDRDGDILISAANKAIVYASRTGVVVLPVGQNSFIYSRQKLTKARAAQYVTRYDQSANTADSESKTTDYSYVENQCVLVTARGVKKVSMPSALAASMARVWPVPDTIDTYISLNQGSSGSTQHKWLWYTDSDEYWPGKESAEPFTSFGLDYNSYSEAHNTPPIYWYLANYTAGVEDWYDLTPEEIVAAYPNAEYGKAKTAKWIRPRAVQVEGGYEIEWYQQPTYWNGWLPDLTEIRSFGRYDVVFQAPTIHQSSSPYLVTCWDAGIGPKCRQLALGLGFSAGDLAI